MFIRKLSKTLQGARNPKEIILLFLLVLLLLWRPLYLHQELNLFEWGLYLPGIDAVFQGQVPYRDFFHLRGPFEVYGPALFMKVFGLRADVLASYFYFGTVVTMLAAVLIAYELVPIRALLYSCLLVLVTRTFPRVAFTFWGGMRYAWGLLAIWCMVRFFKSKHPGWLAAAGCLAAIGWWTSIEIGVISMCAFLAGMIFDAGCRHRAGAFLIGFLIVSVPYGIYLLSQKAFMPYAQAQWIVVTHMQKTFVESCPVPNTILRFLRAIFYPWDENFYQMTPMYTYIFFFILYFKRSFNKSRTVMDHAALVVAVYGLISLLTDFRKIQFVEYEMALQPDKIVLFYLLGVLAGWARQYILFKGVTAFLLAAVILSSVIYTVGRFHTRFYKSSWVSQLATVRHGHKPELINGSPGTPIDLPRIKNMTIPAWQAQDLAQLKVFVDTHVPPHEKVWMYPELGSLYFILDRPWVGKFPMATLSWMDEDWFAGYERELEAHPPGFAIVNKVMPHRFSSYSLVPANRMMQERMMRFLREHYRVVYQTPSYFVYRWAVKT